MKLRYAIWERLKKAKEEKGLTYRELSELTGISQTALTTLFSVKPNCTVGRIITMSKALNRDLSYEFREEVGKILIYPETEREAINNFWEQIDSYYLNPKGRKHYSRKKVYQSMGKAYYKAVGEDNIHLSLDVLEKFSNHLKISPLNLISKTYSLGGRLHFRKQNSLVYLHLQDGKKDVATYMLDGDNARYKVEDWLMGMLAGTGGRELILMDINDTQSQVCLEWGDSLILRLENNGQELYSYKSEKDKANELLTKISRKEKGYDSYLNLLEEKEI